jgi:hypothetical protein
VDTSTPAAPQAPSISQSTQFAIDEAVLDALAEPSLAPTSSPTNVTPAQITEDMVSNTQTPVDTSGKLSIGDKLSMGLINFGKNRAEAADAMFAKGYTAEQIGNFFSETDATVAANQAAVENAVGAAGPDERDRLAMETDPCPEGFVLDPETKVCVVDTGGTSDSTDTGTSWTPGTVTMPTSLPGQSGFSPYSGGSLGVGGSPVQPYPTGGLAATPSPNQAGIIQVAPMSMRPGMPAGPNPYNFGNGQMR